MYTVSPDSRTYMFHEDTHTLAGFSLFQGGRAHSDDFATVATRELERKEGVAFGRGTSENPDRAEAFRYFDARSDDADGDGTPDILSGEYQLVILNAANEVVAIVDRGRLDELREGDPSTDSRGDWGKPFKYRQLTSEGGEVVGGNGHQVGIQLKLDEASDGSSVSDSLHLGNSTARWEGYSGTLKN